MLINKLNAQQQNSALKLKECSGLKDNQNRMKSSTSSTVDKAAKLGSSSGTRMEGKR